MALAELAGRQWGVVSLAPLQALGVGRSGVTRRVQGGRLRRVHRGVYAVGGAVLPREGRWLAAVLACGPAAVLSHVSAAVHWNLLTDQAIAGDPRFTRGELEALMNKLARDYGLPQHECNTSVLCPRRHELRVVLGSTYDPQAARAGEVAGAGTPAASRSLPR